MSSMIGIYEWPVSHINSEYRGLYRGNSILSIANVELKDAFFSITNDGSSSTYTEDNLVIMKKVNRAIIESNPLSDLLMFSERNQKVSSQWVFLGCDVCSDSHYYSPIGAGLLETIEMETQKNKLCDVSKMLFQLNSYGLFPKPQIAKQFSYLCNELQNRNLYCLESEENWRPWFIWMYRL